MAYIPSSLNFSYGVIKLDVSFSYDDFWKSVKEDQDLPKVQTNRTVTQVANFVGGHFNT